MRKMGISFLTTLFLLWGVAESEAILMQGIWTADVQWADGTPGIEVFGVEGEKVSSVSWSVIYDNENTYFHYYSYPDLDNPTSDVNQLKEFDQTYQYLSDASVTFDQNLTTFFGLSNPLPLDLYDYNFSAQGLANPSVGFYDETTLQFGYSWLGANFETTIGDSINFGQAMVEVDESSQGNTISYSSVVQLYNVQYTESTAPVPEPATMLLMGTGLVGLVGSRLRKKKK